MFLLWNNTLNTVIEQKQCDKTSPHKAQKRIQFFSTNAHPTVSHALACRQWTRSEATRTQQCRKEPLHDCATVSLNCDPNPASFPWTNAGNQRDPLVHLLFCVHGHTQKQSKSVGKRDVAFVGCLDLWNLRLQAQTKTPWVPVWMFPVRTRKVHGEWWPSKWRESFPTSFPFLQQSHLGAIPTHCECGKNFAAMNSRTSLGPWISAFYNASSARTEDFHLKDNKKTLDKHAKVSLLSSHFPYSIFSLKTGHHTTKAFDPNGNKRKDPLQDLLSGVEHWNSCSSLLTQFVSLRCSLELYSFFLSDYKASPIDPFFLSVNNGKCT